MTSPNRRWRIAMPIAAALALAACERSDPVVPASEVEPRADAGARPAPEPSGRTVAPVPRADRPSVLADEGRSRERPTSEQARTRERPQERPQARAAGAAATGAARDRTAGAAGAAPARAAAGAQASAAAATGAMGAAGRTPEAATAPVAPASDLQITQWVNQRLAADQELSAMSIDVETQEGIVTLRGTAPSATARARAGDIAREVQGVRSVNNEVVMRAS